VFYVQNIRRYAHNGHTWIKSGIDGFVVYPSCPKQETIIGSRTYEIAMSDFVFMGFLSNGLLKEEERKDKNDNIELTEDELHAQVLQ
jgi:hypothetical protein